MKNAEFSQNVANHQRSSFSHRFSMVVPSNHHQITTKVTTKSPWNQHVPVVFLGFSHEITLKITSFPWLLPPPWPWPAPSAAGSAARGRSGSYSPAARLKKKPWFSWDFYGISMGFISIVNKDILHIIHIIWVNYYNSLTWIVRPWLSWDVHGISMRCSWLIYR